MSNIENWLFINPETYVEDQVNDALEQIINEYARYLQLDNNLSVLAYSEKEKSNKFFEKIIDQPVYFSNDYMKMRRYLIDWYSSHKTQITKARHSTDLNLLSNEELNEFILSYGFPFPRNIVSRGNRIQFLSNLINNYKKKGTPETLANIISLYGLRNVIISEWWLRYEENRSDQDENQIFAKSNVVHPNISRNDKSLEIEKSFDEFISKNPHWQMTYEDVIQAFETSKISLPSITSTISIETHANLVELELACSVFQRKVQESLDYWIGYTLIPLTLNGIADRTIVTSMLNNPPTLDDILDDKPAPYDRGSTGWTGDRAIYLVGTNPTGVWQNRGFEKQLVYYSLNEDDWNLVPLDTTSKWSVFLRNDSILYPNSLLIMKRTSNGTLIKDSWNIYSSFKKDVSFNAQTNVYPLTSSTTQPNRWPSTYVYNGEEWIDLRREITRKLLLNRNENLFRDIPLNSYTSLYSLLEIQLAFAYLHKGTYQYRTNTKNQRYERYFNYYGNYAPLDTGYVENWTRIPPIRNDIDDLYYSDTAYSPILDEYREIVFDQSKLNPDNSIVTFRHEWRNTTPRTLQKEKQFIFKEKFTKPITRNGPGVAWSNLYALTEPEIFLKAINPDFLKEINNLVESDDESLVLENMMVDFENYVINYMRLIESPFAYIQNGGEFFNKKLLPVLNFFKPFRVRIMDFLTKFDIYNPLMDSLLIDDIINDFNVKQEFVEKPFPRNINTSNKTMHLPGRLGIDIKETKKIPVLDYVLGHGLGTEDYHVINIEEIIHEPNYSPLDNDANTSDLDLSMKDAFFITVDEGGTTIYDYRTDENIIVDATGEYEIEIEPVDE